MIGIGGSNPIAALKVVRPQGFEPRAYGLEVRRSIQLSYGRKNWSGRRDSNSQQSAWKADALPIELRPLITRK